VTFNFRTSFETKGFFMEKPIKKKDVLFHALEKAKAMLPTQFGEFTIYVYAGDDGFDHITLVHGDVKGKENVLVRLHSSFLTGDVFGS
jgi:hypothetical protein